MDRALSHEPSERYESAADLAAALQTELNRLGFEDPYLELTAYLDHPKQYAHEFSQVIVARLVSVAERARDERDVLLSASLFNRALAYKPHDSELIAAVARLAKQRVWVRRIHKFALWGGVTAALALAATVAGKVLNSRINRHSGGQTKAEQVAVPVPSQLALPSAATLPSEFAPLPAKNSLNRRAPPVREIRRVADSVSVGQSSETRSVQVVITGASGGRLLIDGAEEAWFGVHHELSTGTHRFEVLPPNEGCCISPPPKLVEISAGLRRPKGIFGHRISRSHFVCTGARWRHTDLR